ncbi:HRDC domain-containing protein [Microcella sp.]|uniref:HRDC domain-containing protein n=1 Tax=Microcella sp. TaxID=1913979 RepID=UPI00299F6F74|nr:HRDC domain-containing protein [Microcella sp.]MDX2025838.1 HRDC domain-containing protein [Microcella sp.]
MAERPPITDPFAVPPMPPAAARAPRSAPEPHVPSLPVAQLAHPPVVIDTRDAYLEAVEALSRADGPVAVDAERASGFRYSQRAYLIQVFRRGAGTFLFDPPALESFAELQAAIGDVEWVLHAASQDLACLRELGLEPSTIFDTELGARLANLPRVGLGAVVEETLGLHLAKEHSAADWSTRPLPASWLTYAALDVELLLDVRDRIAERLADQGKADFAAQEFAGVLAKPVAEPKTEPWRRLSGLSTVRGQRALAVARELWLARDAYAIEVDTSPGRLLPDASIVAAARAPLTSKRELAALKTFMGRASRTQLDRWWAAIEAGLATDDLPAHRGSDESIPPPRSWADRNPEADRRYRLVRPLLQAIADSLEMPLENLLTPEHVRRICWQPPADVTTVGIAAGLAAIGARPWQIDATAQTIAQAFVDALQEPVAASEADS